MVGLWVEVGWVIELTVVVFLIESSLGSGGDSDEVVHMESVGEVLVEVILEVLEQVHVSLNEIVSAYSWEREGLIIEFPGVD